MANEKAEMVEYGNGAFRGIPPSLAWAVAQLIEAHERRVYGEFSVSLMDGKPVPNGVKVRETKPEPKGFKLENL